MSDDASKTHDDNAVISGDIANENESAKSSNTVESAASGQNGDGDKANASSTAPVPSETQGLYTRFRNSLLSRPTTGTLLNTLIETKAISQSCTRYMR
jgi:hypothetical protein